MNINQKFARTRGFNSNKNWGFKFFEMDLLSCYLKQFMDSSVLKDLENIISGATDFC